MALDIFISLPQVAINAGLCSIPCGTAICFWKLWNKSAAVTVSWSPVVWVAGYVVMPEHVHLLFGEPERGDPSVVMKVLKQSFARRALERVRNGGGSRLSSLWNMALSEGHVWQHRFYDFVVFTEKKRVEKLRYMHRNPVVRGLVSKPEEWRWSSYRHYATGEPGPVLINEERKAEMRIRPIAG